MKNSVLATLVAVLVLLSTSTVFAQGAKPRVLIIGDSISIYYTPTVKKLLEGKAVVKHSGHAADTAFGITAIDRILARGKWDVIHFNWGLHDLKKKGTQVPIEQYEKNLREIVGKMKATKAKLIWGTITPVGKRAARRQEDVKRYNAVARKVMIEEGIPIDDLYALSRPQLDRIQKKDNVHFEDAGCAIQGEAVARSIVAVLTGKKTWTPPTVTFSGKLKVDRKGDDIVSAVLTDAAEETYDVVLDEKGKALADAFADKDVQLTGIVTINPPDPDKRDAPIEVMHVTVQKFQAPPKNDGKEE